MIEQQRNNPFKKRTAIDLFEIMVIDEECTFDYFYVTSFKQLEDGRLLMKRERSVATAAKCARKYHILRVRLL